MNGQFKTEITNKSAGDLQGWLDSILLNQVVTRLKKRNEIVL